MSFTRSFVDIELSDLRDITKERVENGWRCVQTHCVSVDTDVVDIIYTFEKDGSFENLCIRHVVKGTEVPSIQDMQLGVFPFENEAHDLFGVNMTGMVLDFQGGFYDLAVKEPMTIITPELKERREKAAKLAKMKAQKEAAKKAAAAGKEE